MKRFKELFIKHRNYLTKGMGEIYAFRAIVMFVTAIAIFVKYLLNTDLPLWIYTLIGVALTAGCWLVGLLWDRAHMYEIETEFSNQRNPAICKLLKRKI